MMKLIYIDDYQKEEEATLRAMGVLTVRLTYRGAVEGGRLTEVDPAGAYEVRGPRLSVSQYRRFYEHGRRAGISLATSPESYEIGADFGKQALLLGDLSPRSVVASAALSDYEVLRALISSGIRFPLFGRSEVESAAKYVGVDGCIVKEPSLNAVKAVVENLRGNVRGFRSLVFKEVVNIAKDEESGDVLEYRVIGVGGRPIMCDDEKKGGRRPRPEVTGLDGFAVRALRALASGGADGGLFVDVAMSVEKGPIVVECKNLINGTIVSVGRFGTKVLAIC